MLLELENPAQQLFWAQLNVHLSSVAPLEFLARPAPARIVAAQLSGRGAARTRGCARLHHLTLLLRRTVSAAASSAVGITGSTLQDLAHDRRWRGRRRVALHPDAEDSRHRRNPDSVPEA